MRLCMMACVAAFLFGACVAFSESAIAGDCSELPRDTKIECFDTSGLSEVQASFCGIWGEGKWDNVLTHCLAVEKIEPSGAARIVYTWGKAPQWRIHQRGFYRVRAIIKGNTLKSKLPSGSFVQYEMKGKKLRGDFQSTRGFRSRIILKRFDQ